MADDAIEITATPVPVVICLTLSGLDSPFKFAVVPQLFVHQQLSPIISLTPLSLQFFTLVFGDVSGELKREVLNLFAKGDKFRAVL